VYDAIVLAGGRASRMGGVDKGAVEIAGQSLLARVLTATTDAHLTIVVGPRRDLPYGVLGACEEPPGGGPVAGLAAGLPLVEADLVVVLACDLPFLTARTVDRLVSALIADGRREYDGAQLVDEGGQRQPLAAAYRTGKLRSALPAAEAIPGTPMRDLLARLSMLDIEASPGQAWDCDTWEDVTRARQRAVAHHWEEA
jgi:molybdopterin-guanine dinucleotide biosynthesis protein A